ncbi:signal recognition particle protein [Candidatus Woesearchaeota archaeon]|nr:signal recognition particle protein [Candidatus Woesearchaeota archaeon]
MVLDKLGESLRNTLQKVAKSIFVDDALVNELVKELQRALLQSDVNVKLVFELSQRIKDRVLKEEVPGSLTKRDYLIKVVYDELVKFLGGEESQVDTSARPTTIMLLGLFGSGKTTTAGKLARYFSKRGLRTAMVQLDVYRPAALDQLQQLGKNIGVPVFGNKNEKDPLKIYRNFESELKKFDVVIVDTAGRDALSTDLINELKSVAAAIKPKENLLVISADIGQAAEKQATAFHDACRITGVIITKLEGTAKGGGALTACAVSGAPVKFIGVGEKVEDLEKFNPKGFVGRLLGMGDIEALLEKAKEAITEEEAKDISEKFLKGEFTLLDLYEQMQAIKKMGPIAKVMEMVPGFGQLKLPKDVLEVQEAHLKKWRHAMDSMTKKELEDPEILTSGRIERIAKGAGISAGEVRDLLKQYRQSKKVVKMFKGSDPRKMQQMLKKMGGMKGMEGFKA